MISLKRWVRHNLDMLLELVLLIMDWINRTPEIGCDYDIATFKSKLYRWIYKSYVLQQSEDINQYDCNNNMICFDILLYIVTR